jgi:uncharacterized protein YjiS (DUF1127 family)
VKPTAAMMTIALHRLPDVTAWLGQCLARLGATLAVRRQRAREREALLGLDARLLKDIGLSRIDAEFAARHVNLWPRRVRPVTGPSRRHER